MQLEPISNFTLYPDRTFRKLQELKDWARIKNVLIESYDQLAGRPYIQAAGKSILYPSQAKLVLEKLYFSWPLLPLALASYICALFFYKRPVGTLLFLLAFLLHTCILGIRSFILNRPPVSNMEETVLYVPWVASLTALLLTLSLRKKTYLAIGASTASILLGLYALKYTGTPFSQVQAVLDSQFWLLIHVLMVVGSYGLFIIAGIIAHITLIRSRFIHSLETHTPLIRGLIQCLYAGVALLILGTILGGIWAAQSWGRFWDWDPKESWAFISCCIYLVLIHLYRFGKIGSSGLAVGAIIGLQAIGFTWYGVNYILGTGLHSYGFGQGGEWWFYSFSLSELIFLGLIGCKKPLNQI